MGSKGKQPFTIAVLSGKGGTGKTMVASNLAAIEKNTCYLDCDVEEPNGHLFFKPELTQINPVTLPIPEIDKDKCIGCRECVTFCRFNALAFVANKPMLFADICHSCGGCQLVCKAGAIKEVPKQVGTVEIGCSNKVTVVTGKLKIGEPSGVAVIKKVLETKQKEDCLYTIIDCPPGSACTVMESIQEADYCLLVAEPTLFGVQNLSMVYELAQLFHKPVGVVLNKTTQLANPSKQYCLANNIPILLEIPYKKAIYKTVSNGELLVQTSNEMAQVFQSLLEKIKDTVKHEKTTGA